MKLQRFFKQLIVMVALVTAGYATAADFAVVLNNNAGSLVTAEEQVQGTALNFGIAVAEDGTVSRVAADAEGVVATVSGSYHSNHGINNAVVTLFVEDDVKVGLGNCQYGSATTVKDGNGAVVATIDNTANCFHQDVAANITYGECAVAEATTLTMSVQYLSYLSVEAIVPAQEITFRDIVAGNVIDMLTAEEMTQGDAGYPAVEFGIAVAEDGTVSRVAADAEGVAAIVSGAYHSNHGMSNATVKVPVNGKVRIGLGNCQYGAASTVKNGNGEVVVTIDNTANCYHQDVTANITYGECAVAEATTLTISAQYLTYLSVEAVVPVDVPDFNDIIAGNLVDMLTAEETTQGDAGYPAVEFGIAVAEDGTVSRVAADAEGVAAIVSGAYHNEHGIGNGVVKVPVSGAVKIGLGNCQYGKPSPVKNGNGEVVATIDNTGSCYHVNPASNITYGYYAADVATTLTISAQYLTYLSVEAIAIEDIPTDITVTYLPGEAVGIVPNAITVPIDGSFIVPANSGLYVEGKTLTGWTDGAETYAVGAEVTVADANIELTPVFAENSVSLADRTEAVTLSFNMGEKNGAPSFAWQGASNGLGFIVTQATVGEAVIDVKLDVDATAGKLQSKGRNDEWAQANTGTILTVPSCKGAVITIKAYGELNATTVDGVALESGSTTATFTCAGDAESVDIVMGENTYLSNVTVELPYVEASVQIQERGIIMTDFTDWTAVPAEGGALDINTSFSDEVITFTFSGVSVQPNGQNTGKFGDLTGFAMAEKNAEGTIVTTNFKNITRVRYFHGATGSNRGFKFEKKSAADADWVVLSDAVANPQTGVWVECDINEENVQLRWTNLNLAQNAYMFELEVYANVEITAEQVTLDVLASPAEAGSVSVYPVSSQYDINTEVTLMAAENFGYDFVNWTDAYGNVIGETAECKYVITENAVVTANFVAVNVYELVVNVEGGANDYMVQITPAPTEVDGRKMFEDGTEVTLTATNNPILTFNNWDGGVTTTDLIVTMNSDQEVTAVYSAVDYLVGWDFIRSGKNSRAADFVSSEDNENAVLVLRNAEGTVSAWLDKSQEAAGGYEGKPAAVNWQQLTDKYYYQTKVNALNFTDIKVQAEMLYNFIAHEVQILEYSLDGETWVEATRVTLPAAKAWTLIEASLPAECDNAEELYLRWIPDYTSNVVGSEGKGNDGTAITNIYVLGNAAIYDDGAAPVVVSTIPANGAENVSATGRIVVNFDEKVQVAEGTVATLGDMTLTPVVSGKVLTFNYIGLDYNTTYTFTLPANTVSDLSGNTLSDAVSIEFTTMTPPVVVPGVYDVEVTTADELLAALEAADGVTRYRIFLYDGVYDLGEKCLTPVKSNISLIGESMDNTIIVNKAPVEGISVSATLLLTGSNIYMQDLTIKNAYDYIGATGRAVCIQDKGDKNVFKNVRMLSYQDTYYTNNSAMRSYHENTEIHGTVDFICGGGDVYFNQSTIYLEERSTANCITAPNGDTDWGYVFSNCVIDGHEINNGQYNLGRPWNGTPRCVWLNTTMKVIPSAAGWTSMNVLPELFAEYNSVTENGNVVDLSGRTTTFTVNDEQVTATYNPVLTAEEAAQYTIANVLAGDDQWQPNMLTEQAIAPNLSAANEIISWEASDYVFCYAVCRNGKVVAFTNDTYYVVPADATEDDSFAVRAANEMGGLSVASPGINKYGVLTGIDNTTVADAQVVSTMVFTIDGMMVPELQNGINIVRTTYDNGVVTVEKVVYRKY